MKFISYLSFPFFSIAVISFWLKFFLNYNTFQFNQSILYTINISPFFLLVGDLKSSTSFCNLYFNHLIPTNRVHVINKKYVLFRISQLIQRVTTIPPLVYFIYYYYNQSWYPCYSFMQSLLLYSQEVHPIIRMIVSTSNNMTVCFSNIFTPTARWGRSKYYLKWRIILM